MKKRILVFAPHSTHSFAVPALLLNLQRHHEQFSRHPEDWEWLDPVMEFKFDSIDQFCDHVIETKNPDVLALGMYVWNENMNLELAKRMKEKRPNCLIVCGGPQTGFHSDNEWFVKHPYIDYGCHVSGYGELFVTELLDQITEGEINESKIPLLCKPRPDLPAGYLQMGISPNPREYVWPKKIYDPDDERLPRWIEAARKRNEIITFMLEGTRGCPYNCTYCEWGGGIGTKISAKPTDEYLAELELAVKLGMDKLFVCDANFGILPRDIEITKGIAKLHEESDKKFYMILTGPAKNNHDRVNEIYDIILSNGIATDFTFNVQTFDKQILDNIKRFDLPWEERIGPYVDAAEKYGLEIRAGLIFPLPGWGWSHFLDELDIQSEYELWGITRYELQVLPNAEMSTPANIEKFGLKLKPAYFESLDESEIFALKIENLIVFDPERVELDAQEDHKSNDLRYDYSGITNLVMSSNAISTKEIVDVKFIHEVSINFQNLGIFTDLTDWLKHTGVKYSEYYDKFVNDWLWRPTSSHAKIHVFQKLWKDIEKDYVGSEELSVQRWRYPVADFPFLAQAQHILTYGWISDPDLLTDWSAWVRDEWGDVAGDLADLIGARTINIDWDPNDGKVHTSQLDWRTWITNRQEPIATPVTLRWKQRFFRGKLLPNFRYGDSETSKLWVYRHMFPITRVQKVKKQWLQGNDFSYLALYSEEV